MLSRLRHFLAGIAAPGLWAVLAIATAVPATAQSSADPNATTHLVNPVVFPEKDGSYTITIRAAGTGANSVSADTPFRLIVDDERTLAWCAQSKATDGRCPAATPAATPAEVGPATVVGKEITLSGIPGSYRGEHKVWLQVDTEAPIPTGAGMALGLSLVTRWTPVVLAGFVLAALIAVILGLLYRKGGKRTLRNGQTITLAQAVFLDTETSTYSLAKLQFYVWTFAGLGGYLYLCLAKSLVQGNLTLADVPGNLPGIILISVGTSVLATGVSSVAGSKGAGDFNPTPSDLITSGGVVAPERLQYLLWTIVGGLAFFFYALAISPAEIQNLPDIPNGFLQLMGISAGGYLGGKIVRGPGPKITAVSGTIAAGGAANGISLVVDGSNLAFGGATYFLAHWVDPAYEADIRVQPTNLPAQADATYATRLNLSVPATPGLTIAANTKYRFTIINPDGEKAVWEFTTPA